MSKFLSVYKAFFLSIAALLATLSINAQIFRNYVRSGHDHPPQYILVMLPTSSNAIKAFEKHNDPLDAHAIAHDRKLMIDKMVQDFNDNFKFCPFYFFIDTNVNKVINRDYEGVLLDGNLQPVSNVPDASDTTHFILRYGNSDPNSTQWKTRKGDILNSDFNNASMQMLIGMNYQFQQLYSWQPYKTIAYGQPRDARIAARKYRYTSKKYNIQYRPQAANYNTTLINYYKARKPRGASAH